MKYSLDASFLIDCWTRARNLPGLLEKLEDLIERRQAQATIEVLRELEKKEDELAKWSKRQLNLFVPIDENIQLVVAQILAKYPNLIDGIKYRSAADLFVIALAKIHKCKVVTTEPHISGLRGKVSLAGVCDSIGVKDITLLDLIKEQKWKFR